MDYASLVAFVEGGLGNLSVREGPMASKERVEQSIAIHLGKDPGNIDNGIWREIPSALISAVTTKLRYESARVAKRWNQYSNEETITGSLFSQIDDEFVVGPWTAKFDFVEFSKHGKESKTGADLAMILDARDATGRRGVKTIWFQAKSHEELPTDWRSLQNLERQMSIMRTFTSEAFGLVYTRHGVHVVGEEIASPGYTLSDFVQRAVECQFGDARLAIFAQSLNRMQIFEVLLDERVKTS